MATLDDIFDQQYGSPAPGPSAQPPKPAGPDKINDLLQQHYGLDSNAQSPVPAEPELDWKSAAKQLGTNALQSAMPGVGAYNLAEKAGFAPPAEQVIKNIPKSATEYGQNLWEAVRHPQETAKTMGWIGLGTAEYASKNPITKAALQAIPGGGLYTAATDLGIAPTTGHEKYIDTAIQHYADRYGSLDKARDTFTKDPVGFLADLSMVVPEVEPLNLAAQSLKLPAKLVAGTAKQMVGHLGTHTGPEALDIAARTGFNNPNPFTHTPESAAFTRNMRGQEPLSETVDSATTGLNAIKQAKNIEYNNSMAGIKASTKTLPFNEIDTVLNNNVGRGMFHGQVIDEAAVKTRFQLENAINQWRMMPPNPFHTPAGFDALKKQIGFIAQDAGNASAKAMASEVYNAVRGTVIQHEPQYATAMKGYEDAMGHIDELQRALSLPKGAWGRQPTIESSLRKLQSSLRDNVNTSFGHRRELVNFLAQNGSPQLLERLAGQALKPWAARGLGRLTMALAAEAALALWGHPIAAAKIAPTLALMSPRIVGEASYYGGKLAGQGQAIARAVPTRAMYQSGALNRYMKQNGVE